LGIVNLKIPEEKEIGKLVWAFETPKSPEGDLNTIAKFFVLLNGRMLATKYQSPLACPLTACAPIAIGAIAVAQAPRESGRGREVKPIILKYRC
jgi:hypothetical protein